MKWTDTFARKTALWDQDFDCIFSKVCHNFKDSDHASSKMSVKRPMTSMKTSPKKKVKKIQLDAETPSIFNSPDPKQTKTSLFSNIDSDA